MTVVTVASYVQTVTGFALGMIIMGVVSGFDLAPIAMTSAIVSLVSISNCAIALIRHGHASAGVYPADGDRSFVDSDGYGPIVFQRPIGAGSSY